jgi:hypothetical protein
LTVPSLRSCLGFAVAGLLALPGIATADTVTVPDTPGFSQTLTWSGTIPPSRVGTTTSSCDGRPPTEYDAHDTDIVAPDGGFQHVVMKATWTIRWAGADLTHDEVLTVVDKDVSDAGGGEQEGQPQRLVGNSDGAGDSETVTGTNLRAATYEAQACGYVNADATAYTGTLTVTTEALASAEPELPSADARGMEFSASVPADPQRGVQVDDGRLRRTAALTARRL